MELGSESDVVAVDFNKQPSGSSMFYVLDHSSDTQRPAITIDPKTLDDLNRASTASASEEYGDDDIDFVDDALLNTAPHNKIEQQLLRGDVVGLALMSGAILWSAMGAFG